MKNLHKQSALVVMFVLFSVGVCSGSNLTASWYSLESCRKEGTGDTMANGRKLNDRDYTAASWDHPFDTILLVCNLNNGKCVDVRVTNRGPAKRLYKRGRVLDLSRAAFEAIGELRSGVLPIKIQKRPKGYRHVGPSV